MGVPKQHRSKSRQRNKRMHIFLEESPVTACPKCGKPVLPHNLCSACGYYGGKEIIDVLAKLTKKEKKQKEKEMKPARNASPARQPDGSHGGGYSDAGGAKEEAKK